MAVNVFLWYDGEMKFSTTKDDPSAFEKLLPTSAVGCNSGEELNWIVSSLDTEIQSIKVKNKKKIPGKRPVKGGWKETWEQKPKKVSNTHFQAIPKDDEATKDNPAVFAWELTYNLKGGGGPITIDPGVWTPPPAPDPNGSGFAGP